MRERHRGFISVKKKRVRPARSTDGRVEKSKKAVLTTTYELLKEHGLNGVSVDEVSRRSGVAKTTIYRHWPSRGSLLLDACSQLSPRPQVPNTGSLRSDLEAFATSVAERLQLPWSSVMPSVIDVAERDKELAKLQAEIHGQMRGALVAVLEQAQKRGEIAGDQDPREMAASILGPLLYRRFFSREPLDSAFARNVVERALRKADH